MNSCRLMIIDGNSILNRAFYGLQGRYLLQTTDGLYTNAVYGFLNILFKYMEEEKPEYICVAFDLKAPTFRHIEYDMYKADRKGMPEELAVQVPVIKEVLEAMSIECLEKEGFEADDIIGSVSLYAEEKGFETVIITGDRDALQLASQNTRIKIPSTKSGKTETNEYNYDAVKRKYEVSPIQLIDVKGLMGDKSDNIPGVTGIGEKTALNLIKEFNSIEELYENIERVSSDSIRKKLENNREMAFKSKKLATIERKIPGIFEIEKLKRKEFNNDRLYKLFKRLEFKSYINKLELRQRSISEETDLTKNVSGSFLIINTLQELIELKKQVIREEKMAVMYFIENKDLFKNSLFAVSIAWKPDEAAFVAVSSGIGEKEFIDNFRDIFESTEIKKIGHDIKPFIVYLKKKGIVPKGFTFDTMLAAYMANPSKATYNICELSEDYLDRPLEPLEILHKNGNSLSGLSDMEIRKFSEKAIIYSERLLELSELFKATLNELGQESLYYDVELPLINVLADMEIRGFKVDREMLISFSKELKAGIDILKREIFKDAGEEFNINSPKQLGVILFEKLGLPAFKKTKTGYSTNAEVLERLSNKHDIIQKILKYRQFVKLESTYVEGLLNMINPATGKIHTSFNQTVTATGRISSAEPNLQNIPVRLEMGKKIRKVFIPENSSFILTSADYSQIELRVLAHVSEDENLIKAFVDNEDIHASTASKIFGIPRDKVTPIMRTRAKAVNFGIMYGIGEFSLSKDLDITREQARKYIEGYLDRYPGVRRYMNKVVEEGREKGFVTTILNRRRYIPELKSKNHNIMEFGKRAAMNTPIQGSAADIIKIAMVKVAEEFGKKSLKSGILLQVHDELIIETFVNEKDQVADILRKCMEGAVNLKVPIKVDISKGNDWYETK